MYLNKLTYKVSRFLVGLTVTLDVFKSYLSLRFILSDVD